MAQDTHIENIVDRLVLPSVLATRLGVVHEPAGAAPYVGAFIEFQNQGSTVTPTLGAGRVRVVAEYSDSSTETLAESDAPWDVYGVIPAAQTIWTLVHGNGQLGGEPGPSDGSTLTPSATPANDERLEVDTAKVLESVAFYWTRN